jgi:gliding motility-associated-like protein
MKISFTKLKSVLLFVLLLSTIESFGQSANFVWYETIFNTDNPGKDQKINDIAVSKLDSSIFIVGSCEGNISLSLGSAFSQSLDRSGFLVKYDKAGNKLWSFKVCGNGDEEITSVAVNSVNEVIIGGYFEESLFFRKNDGLILSQISPNLDGVRNAFVVKVKADGTDLVSFSSTEQLFESLPTDGSVVSDILIDNSDKALVSINFENYFTNNFGNPIVVCNGLGNDAVIAKYNAQNTLFNLSPNYRVFYGKDDESITSLTNNGDTLFIAGNTTSDTIKTKGLSPTTVEKKSSTILGVNENIFISSCLISNLNGAKIETSHNNQKQIITDVKYYNNSLYITGAVNIGVFPKVFLGPSTGANSLQINTSGISPKIFLAKYSTGLIPQWVKVVNTGLNVNANIGNQLDLDANGNIYLTGKINCTTTFGSNDNGYFFSNSPRVFATINSTDTINTTDQDAFIAKYDSNGNHLWMRLIGSRDDDECEGITIKQFGNKLFYGGIFEKKFDITHNGVDDIEVDGNQNKKNILFGMLNNCLYKGGSITSTPAIVCEGEPFTLVAKDYYGTIDKWIFKYLTDSLFSEITNSENKDSIFVTTNQHTIYTIKVSEGTECSTNIGEQFHADPLSSPPTFNLSYLYPQNETDSIEIVHIEAFRNDLTYLWETSPNYSDWTFASNNFNYYYPHLPDSIIYIRRTSYNLACPPYSDATKIVRQNTGHIALLSTVCNLIGDTVNVNMILDSVSNNFTVVQWERKYATDLSFTSITATDTTQIENAIVGETSYRVKLQHVDGPIYYSDTIVVRNIKRPDPILTQSSANICVNDSSAWVKGFNNNDDGFYNFYWKVTSLDTSNTFSNLDTNTTIDYLDYFFPFPNDTLRFERIITVIGCPKLNPNYFSDTAFVNFFPIKSKGGRLESLNDSTKKTIFCKNAGSLELQLMDYNIGDSIRWGYSYNQNTPTYWQGLTNNSGYLTIQYDGALQAYAVNDDLNQVALNIADSVFIIAEVITQNCAPNTSNWFKIEISQAPENFGLGADTTICSSQVSLEAYMGFDVSNINWSADAGGALATTNGSTNTLTMSSINMPVMVTATYTDAQSCNFVDTIEVTFSKIPTLSVIQDQIICNDPAIVEVYVLGNEFLGIFYSTTDPGGIFVTANNDSTYTIAGLQNGDNNIQYIVGNSNCAFQYDTVEFNVRVPYPANAGDDVVGCNIFDTSLVAANQQAGYWTYLPLSGQNAPIIDYETNYTTSVYGLIPGQNYQFTWTVNELEDLGCANSQDTVEIKNGIPIELSSIETGDSDNIFCSTDTVNLSISVANSNSISWYVINPFGTETYSDSSITLTQEYVSESTDIYVVANSNYCGLSFSDTITISMIDPAIGEIIGDDFYCSNNLDSIELNLNSHTGLIHWLQSNDNLNFYPVNSNNDLLTIGNENNSYVQAYTSLNSCISDTSYFTVNITEAIEPILTLPDTVCYGATSIDLSQSTYLNPPNTIGTWSSNATGGNLIPSNYPGQTIEITFTTTECPAAVTSSLFITPETNNDTILIEECTKSIYVISPTNQTGLWNVPNGITYVENSSNNSVTFTSAAIGNNIVTVYYVTVGGGCENNYYYQLSFKPIDTIAYAGEDLILDNQYSTILSATSPTYGIGSWSITSGGGNFLPIDSNNTTVENLQEGDNIILWTVDNGLCKVEDELVVTVNGLLIPTGFSPDGDGINDSFIIRGLNTSKKASLMVYNTLGDQVYLNNNYTNNWNGKDDKGRELTNDTYYLIFKIENEKEYKGYVVLKK